MERILTVLCVHGEGDRATVNQLRKNVLVASAKSQNQGTSKIAEPDEPPDVLVVMRDEDHGMRVEFPVAEWTEVESWKVLARYDAGKRQWLSGARIRVTFAAAPEGE